MQEGLRQGAPLLSFFSFFKAQFLTSNHPPVRFEYSSLRYLTGAAKTELKRLSSAKFADGVKGMNTHNEKAETFAASGDGEQRELPSARKVSEKVFKKNGIAEEGKGVTGELYQTTWVSGVVQLVVHDLLGSEESEVQTGDGMAWDGDKACT